MLDRFGRVRRSNRPPITPEEQQEIEAKLEAMFCPLLEYRLEAVCPSGNIEVPIFGTNDSEALNTFDAAFMLWHNERRIYPPMVFSYSYCPDATELILWHPDGSEVARHPLQAESAHPGAK